MGFLETLVDNMGLPVYSIGALKGPVSVEHTRLEWGGAFVHDPTSGTKWEEKPLRLRLL